MVRLIIYINILAIIFPLIIANDPCRFQTNNGVIDISTLARTDGKAAFPNKIPAEASNYKYSYNPCKPFSEGSQCQNVSVCQISIDGQYQFTLGTQESANLNTGFGSGSNPAISYSYGTKIVYVELVCSTDFPGNLEAMGEGQIETFFFRLTSKCACPNGCQTATTAKPVTTSRTTNRTKTTTTIRTTTVSINDSDCIIPRAIFFKIISALVSLYMITQYQ